MVDKVGLARIQEYMERTMTTPVLQMATFRDDGAQPIPPVTEVLSAALQSVGESSGGWIAVDAATPPVVVLPVRCPASTRKWYCNYQFGHTGPHSKTRYPR